MKIASVAAIMMTTSLALQAQSVISWNFDGYGTINGASALAGVVSAPYWNDTYLIDGNSGAPENNLVDNTGTPTTLGESFTANSQYGYAIQFSDPGQDSDGLDNKRLLNGYANNGNGASVTVSLTGIPYADYDIYVYLSSDTAGRTGTVGVGSTTYDFSTMGPSEIGSADALLVPTTDTTGADPAADYAVFSDLTGSTETITSTIPAYGGIAGFQVVAVPEPGVMPLTAGGLGLLAWISRRASRR